MVCLGIYFIFVILFLFLWEALNYRTPEEEARSIEEEARYWENQRNARD